MSLLQDKQVAYCLKGGNCGNPYDNGKFYWIYVGRIPDCPRCGGGCTYNPEFTDTALNLTQVPPAITMQSAQ